MIARRTLLTHGATATAAAIGFGSSRVAWAGIDQESLVEKSRIAVIELLQDPTLTQFDRFARASRAVLIAPELLKAGFILGAEGGYAAMLARNPDGSWTYPAFYLLAGGSIGLQVGGQVSRLVLTIMTDRGLQAVRNAQFKLGADVSVAAATVGAGLGAQTGLDINADMYAFSLNQGLFAGAGLAGTVVTELADWNDAYYGFGSPASEILAGRRSNPQADPLRASLPR